MKAVRRLLEKDLGLPKKALDEQKQDIADLIDEVCMGCSAHSSNHMLYMLAYTVSASMQLAAHTADGRTERKSPVSMPTQHCSASVDADRMHAPETQLLVQECMPCCQGSRRASLSTMSHAHVLAARPGRGFTASQPAQQQQETPCSRCPGRQPG